MWLNNPSKSDLGGHAGDTVGATILTTALGKHRMIVKYRRAALTAAAAAIFIVQAPPTPGNVAMAASGVESEPRVDETFGRKAVARKPSDLARRAVELGGRGHHSDARALAKRSGDPVADTLVEWLYLKDTGSKASPRRLSAFLARHPDWPHGEALSRAAERSLYKGGHAASEILEFFGERKPETAEGMLALARAKLASG